MGKTTLPLKKPLQSTFWSMCPSCNVKYEYFKDLVNKPLWCQYCNKPYTALEVKKQAPANHTPWITCPYCTVKFNYETISDDDNVGNSSKKLKSSGSFHAAKDPDLKKEAPTAIKSKDNLNKVKSIEANGTMYLEKIEHFVQVFNDFDKLRSENCFKVGQIWSVYDSSDGMPRFYAQINEKISISKFKLRMTWLEPDIDHKGESKFVNARLPISCGNFSKGATQITDERLIFSHRVIWKKGNKTDTYKIYPRKGEIWALFKNWDINRHSNPKSKKYEYEFVQILSDYHEDNGVSIAYLSKVRGFSCVFCRTKRAGVDQFKIPLSRLFRFSHRVPFVCLNGKEGANVPKNAFELDPASLPPKLEEIDIPKTIKIPGKQNEI